MNPEDAIWEEWDVIEDALGGDVLELEDSLRRGDSPRLRRAYCRAVFAYAEGITGWMKRYTILLYYPGMMGDDEKRELEQRDGALESMFRALDLFTDTAGARTPFRKGSTEWASIKSAISIRNRVTHPSKARDVSISDSDLNALRSVREIITRLICDALRQSAAALFRKAKATRAAFQVLRKSKG